MSNFLTWQTAYSEFVFLPCFWPDFDEAAFKAAIDEYLQARPPLRRLERPGGLTMVSDQGSSLPSKPKPAPSQELTTRVLSAIVMIAVALLTAYWGGWPFALFWLAAGIAIMVEWTGMTGAEPRRLVQGILGSGLAVLSILFMVDAGPGLFLAAAIAFPAAAALAARGTTGKVWAVASFAYAAVIVLIPPMVRDHLESRAPRPAVDVRSRLGD